jgi:transglutaminase-like putative cysteine protease
MLKRLTLFTSLPFAVAFAATVVGPRAARAAGDDVPTWLRQAAAASAPTYESKVPAVVLLKDCSVVVSEDGRIVKTTNYAVKILTREGRGEAHAAEPYLTQSGKVREFKAWLISPSGAVRRYGKDETLDVALAEDDVYNEYRAKVISAKSDVEGPGAVFGYQSVVEERTIFSQDRFDFQDDLPTLVSRYTLTLPAGWRATASAFNYQKVEPTVSGTTYAWEVRALAPVEAEPSGPSMSALAPRLAVSYFPAQGTPFKSFESWSDVARFMSDLEDPQATIDDAVASKARELTADAKTELEKIQAIGRYAQGVHYISVQTNIGGGGGYRPHSATEVFAKSYGDCKDKANLMRAMLKAVKIDSYLVSIYSGDPTYVRDEWPSPWQFNHCIIAVRVADDTQAATVVKHPQLGRLLIFDPTSENTPVGDLPDYEQDSLALIDARESTELLRMPVTPPDANRLERTTDVTLQPDGSIAAKVSERTFGQSAALERSMFKQLSRGDYDKVIQIWAGSAATGAKFTKIEPADDRADGRFALDVEFTAPSYAQSMQDRLLVFKPSVVGHSNTGWLADEKRKHPVVLKSKALNETVRFKLPAGFDVDEMPDPVKITSDFGTYTASCEVKDGQLVFTRTLVQKAATIPVEHYADVRNFYGRVRASEDTPVVLARK